MSRRQFAKDRANREERRRRTKYGWLECNECGREWWGGTETTYAGKTIRERCPDCHSHLTFDSGRTGGPWD